MKNKKEAKKKAAVLSSKQKGVTGIFTKSVATKGGIVIAAS